MSIKATMDGQTFSNVTKVTASDGIATKIINLSETGTIATPTATKEIVENGTGIDVLNFAKVNVNVPSTGDGDQIATGTFTGDVTRDITINTGKTDATCIAIIRNDALNGNVQFDTAYTLISLFFKKGTGILFGMIENYAGSSESGITRRDGEVDDATHNQFFTYSIKNGIFKVYYMTSGGAVKTKNTEYTWFAW